jgi:SSS family solute:Na+ symporter
VSTNLTAIDYAVLLVYLVATMGLGLFIGRKIRTGKEYFLAGRRLPWWAIGMSLVATDIGGTDIIGVGGAAYSYGLAVGNFEWIGCVPAMIIAAFVFIPFFWRIGVYTIPEFFERRYNAAVRSVLALCWLVFMACNLGLMLLASAKMTEVLFGWDPSACILLTAALVGIYTYAGGLAAVVYTDTIQCAVMIAGCLLVVVIGLVEVGGLANLGNQIRQLERSRQAAPDQPPRGQQPAPSDNGHGQTGPSQHMALILPVGSDTPFPWPAILFGLALVLSPAYWIGNQAIVQRSLGARSEFEAKASYVWGAVLKNVIPLVIAVPGLIALVKFPDLKQGDYAFPSLVSALLPPGLRGIFLAAFMAALMSSVDSYLNSASTIVTRDLYQRFVHPKASDQHLLWVGRLTTVALVAWAIGFAFFLMGRSEGIYTTFQTMMAFFQGPALAILLAGVLWRRATGVAALIGLVAGIVSSVTLFALSQPRVYTGLGLDPLFQIQQPFLYFSVWAFLTAMVLTVAISLVTPPEPAGKLRYVVVGKRAERE